MKHITTPAGPAGVDLDLPAGPVRALLMLGHGAGGGVDAVDLRAVRDAVVPAGVAVARVTQPYRLAGRRAPAPAPRLDGAWRAVAAALPALLGAHGVAGAPGLPLVVGGRSSGARVACRTAAGLGAVAVVALAFPLHPPGRPQVSRAGELPTGLPTLVVNGDRDPFGVPEPGPARRVEVLAGQRHDLAGTPGVVGALVRDFLAGHGWAAPARAGTRTRPRNAGPAR